MSTKTVLVEEKLDLLDDELTGKIIGAAIEVHTVLGGPGLLESVYESALCHELNLRGIHVLKQVHVPLFYKNTKIKDGLTLDIIVENRVIVEVKATEKNNPIYESQLLTYLRLTNLKLGLLINFGCDRVKNGVTRLVNNV